MNIYIENINKCMLSYTMIQFNKQAIAYFVNNKKKHPAKLDLVRIQIVNAVAIKNFWGGKRWQ